MTLSEKAKEERAAYYREYYQQNKDKIREHQRRYWERKAKEEKASKSSK